MAMSGLSSGSRRLDRELRRVEIEKKKKELEIQRRKNEILKEFELSACQNELDSLELDSEAQKLEIEGQLGSDDESLSHRLMDFDEDSLQLEPDVEVPRHTSSPTNLDLCIGPNNVPSNHAQSQSTRPSGGQFTSGAEPLRPTASSQNKATTDHIMNIRETPHKLELESGISPPIDAAIEIGQNNLCHRTSSSYNRCPGEQRPSPAEQHQSRGEHGQGPSQQGRSPGQQGLSPGHQGLSPGHQGLSPGHQGLSHGQQGQSQGQHSQGLGQQGQSLGVHSQQSQRSRVKSEHNQHPGEHGQLFKEEQQHQSPGQHGQLFKEEQSQHAKVHDEKSLISLLMEQSAPEVKLSEWNGEPLEYRQFITKFHSHVEAKVLSSSGRLARLIDYTSGTPKAMIMDFIYYPPEEGYQAARNLLESEFGNQYVVNTAYQKAVREFPEITAESSQRLLQFHLLLMKLSHSMYAANLVAELNTLENLRTLAKKLPLRLQDRWNRKATTQWKRLGGSPTFDSFLAFVKEETDIARNPMYSREAMDTRSGKINSVVSNSKSGNGSGYRLGQSSGNKFKAKAVATSLQENANSDDCTHCKGNCDGECERLSKLDFASRKQAISAKRLCFGCLKPTTKFHYGRTCRNRATCGICQKRHPTLMHHDGSGTDTPSNATPEVVPDTAAVKAIATKTNETCALSVVRVRVPVNNTGESVEVYCFIDSLANGCFMTKQLQQELGRSGDTVTITMETLAGADEMELESVKGIEVHSLDGTAFLKLPDVYVRDSLPLDHSDIATHALIDRWPHLHHLKTVIPDMDRKVPVGMIIGNNVPRALEPHEVVRSENQGPYAIRTLFGWTVCGPVSSTSKLVKINFTKMEEVSTQNKQIAKTLELMYRSEFEVTKDDITESQEDRDFIDLMDRETKLVDGHYQLPLPIRDVDLPFPNNRDQILRLALKLGDRLRKDDKLRGDYVQFMDGMIAKGYASKVPSEELQDKPVYYIPHHGVYHRVKKQLRVVFNCSKEYEGSSLNSRLIPGPAQNLTNSMVGVLLRFRQEEYAFTADIEKMFYQCRLPEPDRNLLRFFWWDDFQQPPKEHRMNVHLFGAASSPSCASYALKRAATDNEETFSNEARSTVVMDFYVDDWLKSVKSPAEAINLINEVRRLCSEAGFNLTKFIASHPSIIDAIPVEHRAKCIQALDLSSEEFPVERALGVTWIVKNDQIGFSISFEDKPLTRRGMLSNLASVNDPMGLAAPFLLKGRRLLQNLNTVGWDDKLSDEVINSWLSWKESLYALENIKLNRCVKPTEFGSVTRTELHMMCDASDYGYGVGIYIRHVNSEGKVHVALLMGKSRVTPLKGETIPRSELVAATVGSELLNTVVKSLKLQNCPVYCWTDSRVVLGYLNNVRKRFKIFVMNRVRRIKTWTFTTDWHFVASEDNCADDASRGLDARKVDASHRWFIGPEFLWTMEENWPTTEMPVEVDEDDPEIQKIKATATSVVETDLLLRLAHRSSSWSKILTSFALFVKRDDRTLSEVECRVKARNVLWKRLQEQYFRSEIKLIQESKDGVVKMPKDSPLRNLSPYLDSDGLIRVGGRLDNAEELQEDLKHPVILPRHDELTTVLLRHYHETVGHAGRNGTLNEMRRNGVWILNANAKIRSLIHHCVMCRKTRGETATQKMAPLPADRVTSSPPFTYVGCDMFGPFLCKSGRKIVKRYGCMFTCLNSRAVHIEITEDLSTDAFLNALRRFINRRGGIRLMRADNGTGFVGARNVLKNCWNELHVDEIENFLRLNDADFEWKHNPPASSHWGGVWERQIRSARQVLNTLLLNHPCQLTDTGLTTLMTEVEGILNSRPLTIETLSDVNSPLPLAPINLLTQKTKVVMPPPGVFDDKGNEYTRAQWRRVQHLAQQFWDRYRKEYLAILQPRAKWNSARRDFAVGDVVLVKDDSVARNDWSVSKVVEIYPDNKGSVRSVKVLKCRANLKDKKAYLVRPITKLVLLVEAE